MECDNLQYIVIILLGSAAYPTEGMCLLMLCVGSFFQTQLWVGYIRVWSKKHGDPKTPMDES